MEREYPFTTEEDPFESNDHPNPTLEAGVLADTQEEKGDIFDGLSNEVPIGAVAESKDEEDDNVTFLSVWEEQRKQTLEERRLKEIQMKTNIADQAKEEILVFHKEREARIAQAQKVNRAAEEEFKEDMDKVFKQGTVWEQVGKMVNLKADPGDKMLPTRMRDILIQLKNE